ARARWWVCGESVVSWGWEEREEVLAGEQHCPGIDAARLIHRELGRRGETYSGRFRLPRGEIRPPLHERGDGQQHEMAVPRGGEELANRERARKRIFRKLEREAVRHQAACVYQRNGVVPERLGVELVARQTPGLRRQRGGDEADELLEISALRLEVVLRQVHAFMPDDTAERAHDRTIGFEDGPDSDERGRSRTVSRYTTVVCAVVRPGVELQGWAAHPNDTGEASHGPVKLAATEQPLRSFSAPP